MTENTLYWHDYESSGCDPVRDRPLQFAGVRTDEELNIIGEPLNIFARFADDVLPHPEAALITGITPQKVQEKGLIENDFITRVHHELAQPGTCGVGYSSIRFDDEVTRYTLYRNLYDSYAREWQGGNSRWDIIDVVRACHDLRPAGIVWPKKEDEPARTSFHLEHLAAANGITHEEAHDALSDVHATIGMARLIREKQPRLYNFLYALRRKNEVMRYIDLRNMTPILHTSGMYGSEHGCTRMVVPLARHSANKNSFIVFDLGQDPAVILDLGWKQLRERLYTPARELPAEIERPALKQLLLNRCPVVAPLSTLTGESAERLGIDLERGQKNRQVLRAAHKDICAVLEKVFGPYEGEPRTNTDLMLYSGGFFSDNDRNRMREIHATPPDTLVDRKWNFEDKRLDEMLFRFRARNYPETLSSEERIHWDELRTRYLVNGEEGAFTFDAFKQEITALRDGQELTEREEAILGELEEYTQGIRAQLG